jgi:transposase
MDNMINADRDQMMLMPPSIREWLPDDHLAVFIGDIVDGLDLTIIEQEYKGSGKKAYSPRILLSLLFYGYSTGLFSSRKIETATYDSVAFRYLSGDTHPDHDTIAYFRQRFLPQIKQLFIQILLIARQMGVLKVGTVAIDGTKIKANASKHKAMSWKYACRLENLLHREITQLLQKAETTDKKDKEQELDLPEEIRFRKQRLAKIAEAKKAIEERAAERHKKAVAKWDERKQQRQAKQDKEGKKPRGKKPSKPRKKGPEDKDQYNFTDPDSRIMKSHGSFEQCQNAQAAVDISTLMVVGTGLTNTSVDFRELIPTLDDVTNNIGKPENILADGGYYSEENIKGCKNRNVEAYIAVGREKHNKPLKERNAKRPPSSFSPLRKEMWEKVKSEDGQAIYRNRMFTVEAVFGIIKHVVGFRQFSMRSITKAVGEWDLVCLSYNLKRLHQLKYA